MAATAQLTDDYHHSLSIGKGLWDDLVGAALPLKVKDGTFDLGKAVVSEVNTPSHPIALSPASMASAAD